MPNKETGTKDTVTRADTEWGRAIEKPAAPEPEPEPAEDGLRQQRKYTANETLDIAIIGGGLAGLAVAIGLQNKMPHHLTIKIYERAPELRSQSQGILAIHPNGMNALKAIDSDIPRRIKGVGCERHTRTITDINADGSTKETILNSKYDSEGKNGQVAVGITWHNCQQVLASMLPTEDESIIATSHSLSHFVEQSDSVLLFFENGSIVKTKIVLACDGIFSVARRHLYPDDSPIYFGQLNWGTVIKSCALPPNLHKKNGVHYFQYHGDPLWMSMLNDGGSGHTFWQFRVSDPDQSKELSGNNGRGGLGLQGVKDKLVRIAKESCETVASAIEAIPEETIFERSIVGHSTLPTWLSPGGRLALVGDSAHGMHPNIAQGANSAFESAAAVVNALCGDEKDYDFVSLLHLYEKARKPSADLVQQFANCLGVKQASGKSVFHDTALAEMMYWIRSGKDPETDPPPKDVVEILEGFNPLQTDGVSRLWS